MHHSMVLATQDRPVGHIPGPQADVVDVGAEDKEDLKQVHGKVAAAGGVEHRAVEFEHTQALWAAEGVGMQEFAHVKH